MHSTVYTYGSRQHKPRIAMSRKLLRAFPSKMITFASAPNLPAPSPELLALHATCAKVAHLSGAGAFIDELDEDTDDLPVLAQDGRSSEVLNNAILLSLGSIPPSIRYRCWNVMLTRPDKRHHNIHRQRRDLRKSEVRGMAELSSTIHVRDEYGQPVF
ncbi:hypothetical protein VNI00_010991 [Paramarasmius palmivorus]|uniref:Uncharacterized protein n=1 Tax=Paramarasmius palmivorus TaxID=297713 RepID=A0AAW0CFN5_9AGAR